MIKLYELAELSRINAQKNINPQTVEKAKSKQLNISRIYIAASQLYHERLIDACIRVPDSPTELPEGLFLALPERLFGKIAYLSLGKRRKKSVEVSIGKNIPEDVKITLRGYDAFTKETKFSNVDSAKTMKRVKQLLLCHGLSPIGDSLLLLAELGRVFRVASVTGHSVVVMLADISWMCSNRSIRQFDSLTESELDTGLRVCLDKRRRLYQELGADIDLKEITPFDRADGISGKKLKAIGEHYSSLVISLWGEKFQGRLDRSQVSYVCTPLDKILYRDNEDIPKHIESIGQFPKSLAALENALKPHLEILRTIAKQFNTFDREVFHYYFSQYYAQSNYRGISLKIGPISESRFDEPFDKLDQYFKAWGEGHSTTDLHSGSISNKVADSMSAMYLPQYRIGSFSLLPYTPLSLDALNMAEKNHSLIVDKICLLDDTNFSSKRVRQLIEDTPVHDRNRLLSDIYSFVQHCIKKWGEDAVNDISKSYHSPRFTEICKAISMHLYNSMCRETDLESPKDVSEMWQSWLKTIQTNPNPDYTPPHIIFYLLTEDDWQGSVTEASTSLAILARNCYLAATTASP